ncbi:MAG: hypothetical protein WC553_00850 [Patescibacteria group bacterium]|jgi:hypothetical protein
MDNTWLFGNPGDIFWWIFSIVTGLGLIADLSRGAGLGAILLAIGEMFISLFSIIPAWVIGALVCGLFKIEPVGFLWWAWLITYSCLRLLWHIAPEARKGY